MTPTRASWLGIALLHQLLGDNEPLVGDPIEERANRSTAWFWRQLVFAVLARMMAGSWASLRQPVRLEGPLTSFAMLIVLSFQVVVAGSLLDDLVQRLDRDQMARIGHPEWLAFVVLLSFPAAWVIGKGMRSLHWRSRLATILVCGVSAAVVAFVTLSVLSSAVTRFFFPSAALQTAAAMAFVLGLLGGSSFFCSQNRQASS
jgi:hypothetical protein